MASVTGQQIVQDWDQIYDVNTFVQMLPAYNTSAQNDSLLDLMRIINESGDYLWYGPSFPYGSNIYVPAQATVNGSIPLPVGTYVVSMVSYMDDGTGTPPGFMMRLFDKGTKASLSYPGQIIQSLITSNMQIQYGVGAGETPAFGEAFQLAPFITTKPGVINWEITNLSPSTTGPGPNGEALIQVMLNCAAPVNKQTVNSRLIQR